MSNNNPKTHYRKVLKSDHLGCADLEDYTEQGSDLVFSVLNVRQELGAKVAGKKIDANIMYFNLKDGKKVKPLVLNATNAKTMKKMTNSAFIEDWSGLLIKLRIDENVKMMNERVSGVRIFPKAVIIQKQMLNRTNTAVWNRVISAYKSYGNFNKVLEKWNISEEDMKFIQEGCSNGSL